MKKLLYTIALVAILFTACKKGDLVESTPYTKINAGDPAYSFLRFINITPASPNINFYLNSTRISGAYNALSGETGFGYLSFFPNLGGQYLPITPGTNTIDAKVVSSAAADPNLNVFNKSIVTTGGKYYSLVTTGSYTDKKITNSILLEEVKPILDTTKVLIRLVNLFNGGTANLDMVQKTATTSQVLIPNIAVNEVSPYISIPLPGQANNYVFYYTGTSVSPTAYTLTSTLTKGQAYTFFVRGVNGSTTFPFGVSGTASFY